MTAAGPTQFPRSPVPPVTGRRSACLAGERGSGKYSGVVIFDRWGGCTLYSGIYVMYISEGVKEQLRPEAGRPG